MMFISMGIRINAYGVTENRYFVIVGGLWVTGSMFYFAVKKNTANIRIVLAAGLVALLAVFGPWSAYTLSNLVKISNWKNTGKTICWWTGHCCFP